MSFFFRNFAPKFYLGDYDLNFQILPTSPVCTSCYMARHVQIL